MTEKIRLEMPRASFKMERIYGALESGFPEAVVNLDNYDKKILWGIIGTNAEYIKSNKPYIFCDMPYNGRMDTLKDTIYTDEQWDETYWRFCNQGLHDNRKLDVDIDRFEEWGRRVSPWREEGDHILVCPSSNTMTRLMHGCNADIWADQVSRYLSKITNRLIRIRYKPRNTKTSGPAAAGVSIDSDLINCHAVVTSASLTAIDAMMQGVPVFSTHELCPSAWCTNFDLDKIETPILFDREQLFANLAYKQFSIKEMRDGTCYEIYNKYLK